MLTRKLTDASLGETDREARRHVTHRVDWLPNSIPDSVQRGGYKHHGRADELRARLEVAAAKGSGRKACRRIGGEATVPVFEQVALGRREVKRAALEALLI